MASSNAIASAGTLIQLGDGETSETFTTIAEIVSASGLDESVDEIDITPLDSTSNYRQFLASFIDPGELALEMNFVPTVHDDIRTNLRARANHNFKIVFNDGSDSAMTFTGFFKSFPVNIGVGEAVKASLTIRVTGAVSGP